MGKGGDKAESTGGHGSEISKSRSGKRDARGGDGKELDTKVGGDTRLGKGKHRPRTIVQTNTRRSRSY